MYTIIDKGGKIMIKKYIILIFSLVYLIPIFSQDHYWYGNKRVPLILSNQKYVIVNQLSNGLNLDTIVIDSSITLIPTIEKIAYSGVISDAQYNELDQSTVIYSVPTFKLSEATDDIFASQYFYIKLKDSDDFDLLAEYASLNNVLIVEHSNYLPLWYVLSCINCDRNAVEMANIFYESGLFEYAEPDFWQGNDLFSNDSLFDQQWNLRNTGQYDIMFSGIDINYDSACSIVPELSDVIIAVLDQGIQYDHPDLTTNMWGPNYDIDKKKISSNLRGAHGTACAGIIGAISNNGLGISGIFNGKLMSISHDFSNKSIRKNRGDGICYAVDNGAAVISNSWGCKVNLTAIDEAIDYALEKGRNGLGCVVVFATGNDDINQIAYPANSDERIIAVGAISPCGERKSKISCDGESKWGSQFGPELDIMAPGVLIPTTDLTGKKGLDNTSDYTSSFNGTSAACPHVAAVAGLILSVNPTLTAKQVADIIESTAQRVGGYEYAPTEGRPNGKWHEQMGYGLVDAYAAVLAAQPKHIQNQVYLLGQEVYEYATEITAGYAVTDNKPYGNVILEAGSDVTLRAMEQVVLKPGFHAKAGSKLHIKVDSPTTTQSASSPQQLAPRTSSAPTDNKDATMEEVINTVESVSVFVPSAQKIIFNGQLLIIHDGKMYNVMGVEVENNIALRM